MLQATVRAVENEEEQGNVKATKFTSKDSGFLLFLRVPDISELLGSRVLYHTLISQTNSSPS